MEWIELGWFGWGKFGWVGFHWFGLVCVWLGYFMLG